MERFLVKSEHVKTEHKKHRVKSYHEDDGAGVFERQTLQKSEQNDQHFMDQLAAHLARQSGLVKLSDDGNKQGHLRQAVRRRRLHQQWQRVRQGGGLRAGLSSTRR